jgi:hypothetical protein
MAKKKKNEYDVGYKKPPQTSQFKPGESGNPKGKPKGSKKFKTELAEELDEKMFITEGGKQKKIPKKRALIKALMAKAVGGDVRAATALYGMVLHLLSDEEKAAEIPEITKTDEEILEEFKKQVLAQKGSKK